MSVILALGRWEQEDQFQDSHSYIVTSRLVWATQDCFKQNKNHYLRGRCYEYCWVWGQSMLHSTWTARTWQDSDQNKTKLQGWESKSSDCLACSRPWVPRLELDTKPNNKASKFILLPALGQCHSPKKSYSHVFGLIRASIIRFTDKPCCWDVC